MQGSLHLDQGVLYVGSQALTAHVRAYDLDGQRLRAGFAFRAPDGGRASVEGLAVDRDHRIWVADGAARRLRAFTLFGREVAGVDSPIGGAPAPPADPSANGEAARAATRDEHRAGSDRSGDLGAPSDVLSLSSDADQRLVVASAGRRRHAVQVLELAAGRSRSLRPLGDPAGRFAGACDLSADGPLLYVCERLAGRVQVFRDGEFHYAFELPVRGARFEPRALAPLGDGRLVVCQGGPASALLLLGPGPRLLRVLAGPGAGPGEVLEPNDVVVERGEGDPRARILVIDRDGDRVQSFTLTGICHGTFPAPLELHG